MSKSKRQQADEAHAAKCMIDLGTRVLTFPDPDKCMIYLGETDIETAGIAQGRRWKMSRLKDELACIREAVDRAMALPAAFGLQHHFEKMRQQVVAIKTKLADENEGVI